MSGWYKSLVERAADISNLDSELTELERKNSIATGTDDYILIMADLDALNVVDHNAVAETDFEDE